MSTINDAIINTTVPQRGISRRSALRTGGIAAIVAGLIGTAGTAPAAAANEARADAPHLLPSFAGYAFVSAPEHRDAVRYELDAFMSGLAGCASVVAEVAAERPGLDEDKLFGRLAAREMQAVKWNIPAEYGEEAGALMVRDVFGLFAAGYGRTAPRS
jgi:hypothetical protein